MNEGTSQSKGAASGCEGVPGPEGDFQVIAPSFGVRTGAYQGSSKPDFHFFLSWVLDCIILPVGGLVASRSHTVPLRSAATIRLKSCHIYMPLSWTSDLNRQVAENGPRCNLQRPYQVTFVIYPTHCEPRQSPCSGLRRSHTKVIST